MRKLFLLFLCLFIAGCATANKGSYQEIEINSNVVGALVELDGVEIGRTPFKGKINRDKMQKIIVKIDYAFNEIKLEKRGGLILDACGLGPGSCGGGGMKLNEPGEGALSTAMIGSTIGSIDLASYTSGEDGGATKASVKAGAGPKEVITTWAVAIGAIALIWELQASADRIRSAAWEYSPSQYYVELKEEGRSDMDFINDFAIRYFTTMNHSQIAIDASNDGGEYVEALADLMETKKDRETAKRDINEALEESKGDQVAFGDALVAKFKE